MYSSGRENSNYDDGLHTVHERWPDSNVRNYGEMQVEDLTRMLEQLEEWALDTNGEHSIQHCLRSANEDIRHIMKHYVKDGVIRNYKYKQALKEG